MISEARPYRFWLSSVAGAHRRHRIRVLSDLEVEAVFLDVHRDQVATGEGAPQYRLGHRVLDEPGDRAAQRPRAHGRVEPFLDQSLLGGVADLEPDVLLGQLLADPV